MNKYHHPFPFPHPFPTLSLSILRSPPPHLLSQVLGRGWESGWVMDWVIYTIRFLLIYEEERLGILGEFAIVLRKGGFLETGSRHFELFRDFSRWSLA